MSQRERIGVFGGAFDPPHRGHVALAHAAIAQLDLSELRIVPTGQAWHKSRPLSPAPHRLAMCQAAFGDGPGIRVDEVEIQRDGPSYTVDTLEALHRQRPDAQIHLLIGQDQAQGLPAWHRAADLARLAIIWVAVRPDEAGQVTALDATLRATFSLQALSMSAQAVSSTDIRHRVAHRQPVQAMLPDSVARYIADHHLYQTP